MRKEEISVLRELAKEYMEIATLPIQREKMEMWKAFNRHEAVRPMVLIDQLPWHELNYDGSLTCVTEDPMFKNIEFFLRSTMYKWKHFPVDMVVEPMLKIPYAVSNTGYGVSIAEETLSTDKENTVVSHQFTNQFLEEEDIDKIQDMKITLNKEKSKQRLEQAQEVFDGIIPLRQAGNDLFHLGIWEHITMWMGVNDVYFDLIDRPEFIHKILEKMTHSALEGIRQSNELGIVDTSSNICHCSVTYNDELLPDFGAGKEAHTKNAWNFGLAQLFTSVSPEITKEFEVPYVSQLASQYGMVYYGCCDRLDDRLDIVQKIPNVKKISCSPWSDREAFAEKLNKDIIMSNKPTPAFLAKEQMNIDEIAKDLKRTCAAAKNNGKTLEFILKDLSTVCYQPNRLTEWADCAMNIVKGME